MDQFEPDPPHMGRGCLEEFSFITSLEICKKKKNLFMYFILIKLENIAKKNLSSTFLTYFLL